MKKPTIDILINKFQERAKVKRRTSNLIIAFIILTLAFGLYVFYFADEISTRNMITTLDDSRKFVIESNDKIESDINDIRENINQEISDELNNLKDYDSQILKSLYARLDTAEIHSHQLPAAPPKELESLQDLYFFNRRIYGVLRSLENKKDGNTDELKVELKNLVFRLDRFYKQVGARDSSTIVDKMLREIKKELKYTGNGILSQESKFSNRLATLQKTYEQQFSTMTSLKNSYDEIIDNKNQNTYMFISAIATRIGSVLILIFLVQILIRLYRYNIRLASYYEARADALELALLQEGVSFSNIVGLLSPDNHDIGKAPNSPQLELAELISALTKLKN